MAIWCPLLSLYVINDNWLIFARSSLSSCFFYKNKKGGSDEFRICFCRKSPLGPSQASSPGELKSMGIWNFCGPQKFHLYGRYLPQTGQRRIVCAWPAPHNPNRTQPVEGFPHSLQYLLWTCIRLLQLLQVLNCANPQNGQACDPTGRCFPQCWHAPFDILRSISLSCEKSFFWKI